MWGLAAEEMSKFVDAEFGRRVPWETRADFAADVLEGLEQMHENRLAGLGVTPE